MNSQANLMKLEQTQCLDNQHKSSKSILGYLSFVSPAGYSNANYYLVIDALNQPTQYFEIDQFLLEELNNQKQTLDNNSYVYAWVSIDDGSRILNWRLFNLPMMLWEFEPIYQVCYQFESLYQLILIGNNLQSHSLSQFFWLCFKDVELMKSFVSLPASKQHHHSFPGGLLAHSLECARFVYCNLQLIEGMSQNEIEVTLLAALFHDIGKTHTLMQTQHTNLGRLLDHEHLTLMILANELSELNKYWSQGAHALQYLLTWTEKQGFCKFVGGNLIKMADRVSTSSALRKMGFSGKPKYYHFAALNIGGHNHYMNRLP
jgi:hypothetical protein